MSGLLSRILALPGRAWATLVRQWFRLLWWLAAGILRGLWRALSVPERWLSRNLSHAVSRHALYLPLPRGFDPQTGRLIYP